MLPRSTELRSDIGVQLSLPFDQRWRNRRSVFVPPRAVFDPKNHSVDVIAPYKQAKPFVQQHHYSGSYIGYFAVGLFAGRELVGVASFGNAGNKHVISSYMPFDSENCC